MLKKKKRKPVPFVPIDVKGGEFTFAQRLELGSILAQKDKPEYEMFLEAIKCLYGREPVGRVEYRQAFTLWQEAIEGLAFWVKVEAEQLKYHPTADENDAGIDRFSSEVGELGTVYSIAKAFGKDPDEILLWKYGKVFGYLRGQKAEADFQRRYQDVMKRKSKSKK